MVFEEFTFDDFSSDLLDIAVKRVGEMDRHWKVSYGGSICNSPSVFKGII